MLHPVDGASPESFGAAPPGLFGLRVRLQQSPRLGGHLDAGCRQTAQALGMRGWVRGVGPRHEHHDEVETRRRDPLHADQSVTPQPSHATARTWYVGELVRMNLGEEGWLSVPQMFTPSTLTTGTVV